MTAYSGNPVTFSALPAVHVTGNPVTFSAPRIWAMRATASGLVPIQLARGSDAGVEALSPPV